MAVSQHTHVVIILLLSWTGVITQDMIEYCPRDTFQAQCGRHEIVVMTAANYGRMRLGKCVKKDLGYVGCYVDALEVTDHLCSGRHGCEFRVPDVDVYMRNMMSPCLEELQSYLEASFSCIRVQSAPSTDCRSSDRISIGASEGYIASITSEETGCGTGATPWVIEQQPGQQINLTLFDFSILDIRQTDRSAPLGQQACHAYAIIRERDIKDAVTICGGLQRERHIYRSQSNRVEVRFFARKKSSNFPYFMIKYKAIGCPDFNIGNHYEFKRNGQSGEATCKSTGETWRLKCNGATWTGRVGNCSAAAPSLGEVVLGNISLSFEISVIIITVIASLISLCILVVGIICLRRKRAMPARSAEVYGKQGKASGPRPSIPSSQEPGSSNARHDGNEYACILDMPLPAPPIASSKVGEMAPPSYDYDVSLRAKQMEHMSYQTAEASMGGMMPYTDDPRYFELDPDMGPPRHAMAIDARQQDILFALPPDMHREPQLHRDPRHYSH